MPRRGPVPGSDKSGDAIAAALDRLEGAVRAAIIRGDIGYSEATALWKRADALAVEIEERLVCGASDYPDED